MPGSFTCQGECAATKINGPFKCYYNMFLIINQGIYLGHWIPIKRKEIRYTLYYFLFFFLTNSMSNSPSPLHDHLPIKVSTTEIIFTALE